MKFGRCVRRGTNARGDARRDAPISPSLKPSHLSCVHRRVAAACVDHRGVGPTWDRALGEERARARVPRVLTTRSGKKF